MTPLLRGPQEGKLLFIIVWKENIGKPAHQPASLQKKGKIWGTMK